MTQKTYRITVRNYSLLMPNFKILILGIVIFICSCALFFISKILSEIPQNYFFDVNSLSPVIMNIQMKADLLKIIAIVIFGISLVVTVLLPDNVKIAYAVRRTLFDSKLGNPLHFKEGELLPNITCKKVDTGEFVLKITAVSVTCEDISNASTSISSGLNNKYKRFAVTNTEVDVAFNEVHFTIEDVTTDKALHIKSVDELKPKEAAKLIVQQNTYIDLTTSGSMLVAGKTRSGKTTAIISLLLQALLSGRDDFGSEIIIIDPKQAELSRLPHVYTLNENGEASDILSAIQNFANTITQRQQVLNELSEQRGDVVKWWEAGMHVSFLFVDEYVSARTIFPKKADKENPDYCLATFDGLVKRIVTMGASAGCYMIISIAEASVDEGGLPSMLRSAMSTKLLFKPTIQEGRLMWDSDKLKDFSERVYNSGDAWFSSTDGIHDRVSYVHFPVMEFQVYKELGHLLEQYYHNDTSEAACGS